MRLGQEHGLDDAGLVLQAQELHELTGLGAGAAFGEKDSRDTAHPRRVRVGAFVVCR
jgi:hypothetical protein